MAYDEGLAERIRDVFVDLNIVEKKMFGGLAFMYRGHMTVGVVDHRLMVRVPKEQTDEYLARDGAQPMDFTGKTMRGMVFVDESNIVEDEDLEYWCRVAQRYSDSLPEK